VSFTPPVVVAAGEWVVAQAVVNMVAAWPAVDTGFYIFVDSNP
jgi:hypothetical protein